METCPSCGYSEKSNTNRIVTNTMNKYVNVEDVSEAVIHNDDDKFIKLGDKIFRRFDITKEGDKPETPTTPKPQQQDVKVADKQYSDSPSSSKGPSFAAK